MVKKDERSLVNYDKIFGYFKETFPMSKIITTTTAESMKIILRKPVGNYISWAQMGVEGRDLIVYEKMDSLKSISEDFALAIRKEIYSCLEDLEVFDLAGKDESVISKIVYFESVELPQNLISRSTFEVVKMHEILSFIRKVIPDSEIIDSGHGLRIRIGSERVFGEDRALAQLVVKNDCLILTPNIYYFSDSRILGENVIKNIELIIHLNELLDEESIFQFGKKFRFNYSFGESSQMFNKKKN